MFMRSERLFLRPGWPEDWEELLSRIQDEAVVMNLAKAPWPYTAEDARWFAIDQLPPLPMQRSIARYLIDLYVARRLGHPEPQLPR